MKNSWLYYDEMDTDLGPITFIMKDEALCALQYGKLSQLGDSFHNWLQKHFKKANIQHHPTKLLEVMQQFEKYFSGERTQFEFSYELYGTPFQKQVWSALKDIPYGETRTYKDIAHIIGAPSAQRAVGGAVNRNPLPILLPCHRVVGSNGNMTGYAGGIDKKAFLLKLEKTPLASQ
ncbi:methylated-DNA-[protein]-cysteine S-methyltransferase/epoxyqueuosine reductase [Salinibacillus kushneri]|uniref:Methylated-DNA--protein-cysteine methyltransferase n=1 Tax=Salinibacillus kushneri TaxID=237682 RepID=A0A1I0ALA0_9BACI|nr:methylated-DNA--[protein]-cysteine S-methyltransferase [Salinibacillus kushneri]SES95060.1 methylated-DNA-[protein]-cysteine S-methyltransferase/epoxyqueuosine reductase [Salinibacillus kushneri]